MIFTFVAIIVIVMVLFFIATSLLALGFGFYIGKIFGKLFEGCWQGVK
jgi:hypothetical protein